MFNVFTSQDSMSYNILCPIATYTLAFLLSVSFCSRLTFLSHFCIRDVSSMRDVSCNPDRAFV